jgi:hypothetical protein
MQLSSLISSNRKSLAMWSIVIIALMIDTSLVNLSDIIRINMGSWKMIVFFVIAAIYGIGQFLVLGFIKDKSKEIRTKSPLHLNTIFEIVTIVQYALTGILLFVILQMIVWSYYSIVVLITAASISYILAIAMMGILAQRFFLWYKSNRNTVVLLYGLASVALSINAALTLVITSVLLQALAPEAQPSLISPSSENFSPLGRAIGIINSFYIVSSIVSFIIIWCATAMLLRHYSQGLKRVKYWIIVSLPLVYFLSQFVSLFLNLFAALLELNPVFFSILLTLIFTMTKPAGGILFGFAFRTVAKNINQNSVVRDYLIISAYGLVLLFVSNQAVVLVFAPYPPFGLATISFMGLSSYLILVGIYSSAISVSVDGKLRQSIRKTVIQESNLLDSIGTAQMAKEIENKVIKMTQDNAYTLTQQSGVEPSLTQNEIKLYVEKVLDEVKTKRHSR